MTFMPGAAWRRARSVPHLPAGATGKRRICGRPLHGEGGGEKVPPAPGEARPNLLEPAQFLPWIVAKPPIYVPPVRPSPPLMRRIPRRSGKDSADDIPAWSRGQHNHRRVGEEPRDYAQRLMDEKYRPGNWGQTRTPESARQNREFNQLKKWGARAFESSPPFLIFGDEEPQA